MFFAEESFMEALFKFALTPITRPFYFLGLHLSQERLHDSLEVYLLVYTDLICIQDFL